MISFSLSLSPRLTTELRDRVDYISRLENDKACLLGEQEELQQLR